MKYNIWTESCENSWNDTDTNTTDAHIRKVWSNCMETLDEGDDTDFIRHALDENQRHAKNCITCEEYEMEIEQNEYVHFKMMIRYQLLEKIIFVKIIPIFCI